jgi:hypothetical protein
VLGSNELNPFPWETNTSPAPALAPVSVPDSVLEFNLVQDDPPRWKANKLGGTDPVVAVAATMAASAPEMLAIAGGAPNVAPVAVQVCMTVPCEETMYRFPGVGEIA